MAELTRAGNNNSGKATRSTGDAGKANGDSGDVGAPGETKLLYVTPEMLVKSGKLASALEALASRCYERLVALTDRERSVNHSFQDIGNGIFFFSFVYITLVARVV